MPHIHIHLDVDESPALRLHAARLAASIAGRPNLSGQFTISESLGSEAVGVVPVNTDVLFTGAKLDFDAVRREAPILRWVQTTYAGVENVLPSLPADLQLTNASGVHADKGGEFVLLAALMLAYRMPTHAENQRAQSWRQVFVPTLSRSRVTILGVGAIGGGAARRLRQQGCHVIGVTRSGASTADLDRIVGLADLDAVLRETDILVSTLPATPATRGLIDRRRIGLLPHDAGIIIVGRAAVLDYDAIMDRLDDGTLSGAVLDVFPEEPIPAGNRIWTTSRLIVSPHCSVDDHSVYLDSCEALFLDNLERFVAGKPLLNLVDPSRGY